MMNRATRAAVGTLIIAAALQHGECLRVSGARSPTRARCGVPSRLLRMAADANDAQFNEELPPSLLADAWTKQDIVKDLVDRLKGCSIVIVGHRRAAQSSGALALARRLKDKRYRYLDLYDIVTQCAGGKSPAEVKEAEGEEGLRALETAILSEAKAWPRCVLFAANAGSTPANWAHMQQAIVVCIEAKPGPKSDDLWVEQADVTVQVSAETSPDETALLVAKEVLQALKDRPPRSKEWMEKRDQMLKERGIDPDNYDEAGPDDSPDGDAQ